ncbi:MAG: hypothetical protein EOP09_06160 [Proteobacteria bacterium]|nr:MAG: hypothetical protein EOP09_06160 [Pseudomonadota bacterium]
MKQMILSLTLLTTLSACASSTPPATETSSSTAGQTPVNETVVAQQQDQDTQHSAKKSGSNREWILSGDSSVTIRKIKDAFKSLAVTSVDVLGGNQYRVVFTLAQTGETLQKLLDSKSVHADVSENQTYQLPGRGRLKVMGQ